VLGALFEELAAPATLVAVERITGRALSRVEAKSYVYAAGSYLLPHTDNQRARRVSFALYLDVEGHGGELDLYACRLTAGAVVGARVAATVAPRPGRLVLFDVSPASLHRVREVTAGRRVSVAGWFLA
jgi:Rps23 Pro-64 3,4-dihydroxylase Tpa1-like proline 4-hydroxylase